MNDTIRAYLYNEAVGRLLAPIVGTALIVGTMRFIKARARAHAADGDSRYRALKTQRPDCPDREQFRLQGAGLQVFRRLPVSLR